MFPIEINLTPEQVRKILAKFLNIDPNQTMVEYKISDVSDDRYGGGPNMQLTSIKIGTNDVSLWGHVPALADLDK